MIRLASRADVPALAALRRSWVEENAGSAVPDEDFEDAFASWFDDEVGRRVMWLAEVDGVPVGMLNMMVFDRMPRPGLAPSSWGYLANLYVVPQHRGAGTGAELVASCTAYADEHRFVRVVLSPSERSVPLYQRAGFGPAEELMVRRARH